MIVIIDYGIGNLISIQNMIKKAGGKAEISNDVSVIEKAAKLILPGIGSFDHGMENLRKAPYFDLLNKKVKEDKIPILGVCLGLQLFTESSEEGSSEGLGWISGHCIKFKAEKMDNPNLKIPHMDWTETIPVKESKLFINMYSDARFYFVHSYHIVCRDTQDILITAHYGYDFVAGVEKDNIIGVQFHPEKSHKFGLKIYENFLKYY